MTSIPEKGPHQRLSTFALANATVKKSECGGNSDFPVGGVYPETSLTSRDAMITRMKRDQWD